ncbi:MAG: hypothetical protein ND895_27455 [Pyrinomonadaceae bacterium]|nr:hypothetical protein [Pyrinomonadaceae bacterium]
MPRTRLSSTSKVVKGVVLDVRFGAEIIDFGDQPPTSANLARLVGARRSWIDSLVGLFDDSPLNAEVLQNEREARALMDAEFVMPE